MSIRSAAASALLLACGCTSGLHWEKEAWSDYYPRPKEKTERRILERKVVHHWTADPSRKSTIAILEKFTVVFEGSRTPREYYEILNGSGTRRLGHISEEGIFYRFTDDGGMDKVGEYLVIDTGLKVFFGFPLSDHLGFEEVDPYRD